tara:strand:+ start:37130 stop:37969 length:840 start_codon:yes stop_codon:yes gene_type:complete
MLDKIKISVIIPCYNCEKYIEKAIDSLLNQTIKENIEIILIDDGSNLETKSILKKIEHKVTKLITQENKGQSTARNVGLNYAKADIIIFVDSDDYVAHDYCEIMLENFSDKYTVFTCIANIVVEDKVIKTFKPRGGGLNAALYSNISLGPSMFKKKDLIAIGGYDQEMTSGFEDWEMLIRLLKFTGKKVYVIDKPLYYYRKGIVSTTTHANEKKYELLQYIYSKHEELYKVNFKEFTAFLLNSIKTEEEKKSKVYSSPNYRIGSFLLKPIRFVKRLLNA